MTEIMPMDEFEQFKNSIPKYKMGKDVKDHLCGKMSIPKKDVQELAVIMTNCIDAMTNHAYNCCLITMWAGRSKSHQEGVRYVVRKHVESDHKANKFMNLIAQKTFSSDSPRTAHLPEAPREAIAKFSAGNAVEFYAGERVIQIYQEDESDECVEKKFKDLTEEELSQTFSSTGIYRVKSKQWRYLASRDRTAVDRHLREDTIWVKQGRKSMTELLSYADELIKHVTSLEVADDYIKQFSEVLKASRNKAKSVDS